MITQGQVKYIEKKASSFFLLIGIFFVLSSLFVPYGRLKVIGIGANMIALMNLYKFAMKNREEIEETNDKLDQTNIKLKEIKELVDKLSKEIVRK